MNTQVLVPLKPLAMAKQRLSPDVSMPSRRRLMLHMLRRTVEAAQAAEVGPVALATSEPTARELASVLGVDLVSDGGLDWNEGLLHALRSIRPLPAAVLYLSADLPLVSAADILHLIDAAPDPGVAIARAHHGGTNALLIRPAEGLIPMFGHQPSASATRVRPPTAESWRGFSIFPGWRSTSTRSTTSARRAWRDRTDGAWLSRPRRQARWRARRRDPGTDRG